MAVITRWSYKRGGRKAGFHCIRNNVATMLLCCVKNRSQSEEPSVVLTLEDANEILTFAAE